MKVEQGGSGLVNSFGPDAGMGNVKAGERSWWW